MLDAKPYAYRLQIDKMKHQIISSAFESPQTFGPGHEQTVLAAWAAGTRCVRRSKPYISKHVHVYAFVHAYVYGHIYTQMNQQPEHTSFSVGR